MDYHKIYYTIIDKARIEQRKKKNGIYYEKHHIIPKCCGGTDNRLNMILLTAREHFICHWLLHLMHPNNDKLLMAFSMMCQVKSDNQKRNFTPSSRLVEYVKIEHSKRMSGDNNPKYWKGKKRPDLKKISPESCKKISDAKVGHSVTQETIDKIIKTKKERDVKVWNLGLKTGPLPKSHKNNISKANTGKKKKSLTSEQKEHIRNIQLEYSSSARKVIKKDLDGNAIETYKSVKEAIDKNNLSSRIFDCLKGKYKNFKWEYADKREV